MNRLISVFLLIVVFVSISEGAELTIQPSTADNFIRAANPTTNYGGETSLEVKSHTNNIRAILKFDFTALDNAAVISNATLSLYFWARPDANPVGRTYWAYRITQTGWVENQSTWNIYSTGNNWATAGGDYTTSDPAGASMVVPSSINQYVNWDVTTLTQDAQSSRGEVLHVLIRDGTESSSTAYTSVYYAKENATNKPKLVITYTIPGGSFVPKTMIIQ